mmetsp:Transcript_58679/g.115382  ORF Transcript_58679/g.115382 Transcript_58679/m.115382 type:complete len:220 (-) Transcript_58679:42-701(-)
MYYKLTMFKPSETANDLFRRLNNRAFNLRTRPDRMEQLLFGSTVEVQMNTPEISEFVLGTAVNFATQFEDGFIFHISIGNNLFNSLLQGQVNLSSTSLYRMHGEGRFKTITVPSLLHLWSVMEFLKLSLNGEKVLILFEGLSTLFLAHKGKDVSIKDPIVHNTLKSLQSLIDSQYVIALWINSVSSKQLPGLRDGPNATKDTLTVLWKQYVPKVFQCSA